MKKLNWVALVIVVAALAYMFSLNRTTKAKTDPVNVGLVVELTGDIPAVGASSRNAAQLAVAEANATGGWVISGQKHQVNLLIEDNGGNADQTKAKVDKLINQDHVVAIIGPNASRYAIPAGDVAEANKTVLISPWSTNPQTTLDSNGKPKHYVFRAAYTDPFQGEVLAKYASTSLKSQKVAILYDNTADVLAGQAKFFKDTFEKNGGKVVTQQTFAAGAKDFSGQLNAIKAANPDIIFLPAYYNDAAAIIKQAHSMGITTQFLGSDAWASDQFLPLCGKDCEGYYLTAHYSSQSTNATTQQFVANFKSIFATTPDDVAALTYDSFGLLGQALKDAGKIDREAVRTSLASIKNYAGVTGNIQFAPGSGDPTKGAVIMQIKNGAFVWHADVQP